MKTNDSQAGDLESLTFLRQFLEPEALKGAPVLDRSLKIIKMWCHRIGCFPLTGLFLDRKIGMS